MIITGTLLTLILLAIGFYLLFFGIPLSSLVRNLIAIVVAIVLLALLLNLLGALSFGW